LIDVDIGSVCAQLSGSAHLFELRRVPLLYVYSDADNELVDPRLNAEFAEMFNARRSVPTDVYSAQCQPIDLCQKFGNSLRCRF